MISSSTLDMGHYGQNLVQTDKKWKNYILQLGHYFRCINISLSFWHYICLSFIVNNTFSEPQESDVR
jgi:hypothetical protein